MNKTFGCAALIFLLALPPAAMAQTRKITGTVVAFNRYPLNNITVKARKAKTQAVTDGAGSFELEIGKSDVLIIAEPGFVEYKKNISASDNSMHINLIVDTAPGSREKITQAQYLSPAELEYGLLHLAHENNVFSLFTDIYEAIRYAEPTASIIMENGRKGVMFRGNKTFEGSQMALIVVNGVIMDDVSSIIPNNVVTIRKLSGPAAAIYGSRAGNGVVAIETR